MSYLGKAPGAPGGVRTKYEFVATAGQTTFSGADINGAILAYEPGFADVYVGGILMAQSDVTAVNGSSITFAVGLNAGRVVQVEAFGTFKVADAMPVTGGTFTGGVSGVTPAQFDNDTSLATTEFVQRALGNYRNLSAFNASAVLTNSVIGGLISFYGNTAGQTLTLPMASIAAGGAVTVFNQSSVNLTVARQAADSINAADPSGVASTASITLTPGDSCSLVSNGDATWNEVGRRTKAFFGSSLAVSGYQKLPSGLIIQWGQVTGSAGGTTAVTFPIAFPNACRQLLTAPIAAGNARITTYFGLSKTGFSFDMWNLSAARLAETGSYLAIGD